MLGPDGLLDWWWIVENDGLCDDLLLRAIWPACLFFAPWMKVNRRIRLRRMGEMEREDWFC